MNSKSSIENRKKVNVEEAESSRGLKVEVVRLMSRFEGAKRTYGWRKSEVEVA